MEPNPPKDEKNGEQNALFRYFINGLFGILILYGVGTVVVVLIGDGTLALRMLSAFGTMFAGILGLGSGYLLGKR